MDPMATEIEVTDAVAGLIRALQPEYVIETGTASAQTTVAIGKALRRNGHGQLVSLEIDPKHVAHGRELCKGLPVEVRQQSSLEFEPARPIDFAWFDTDTAMRHSEFLRYRPFMHAKTVVGFHDTGPRHPTRGHLDKLEADGLLKTIDLPSARGFSLGQPLI